MEICNYKNLSTKDIIAILNEEKMCYLATTDTTNISSVYLCGMFLTIQMII